MPELVGTGGGAETRTESDVEATGGDNEGLKDGVSCHAADVSKPKGSITIVPPGRIQDEIPLYPQGNFQIEVR